MSAPRHQILAEAGRAFAAAFDPIAVPWNVVHFFVPRLADCALIGLLDEDGSVQRAAHAHLNGGAGPHFAADDPNASTQSTSRGAIGHVLRSGRPVVVGDLGERVQLLPTAIAAPETRALLIASLAPRRRPLGVLILGANQAGRFGIEDARLACALALRAGVVLDIASRCRHMRHERAAPIDSPQHRRQRGEELARARRRAELTRQLIARA
jgi:GAF domain-containing protein